VDFADVAAYVLLPFESRHGIRSMFLVAHQVSGYEYRQNPEGESGCDEIDSRRSWVPERRKGETDEGENQKDER
jgi:hypothetical protein